MTIMAIGLVVLLGEASTGKWVHAKGTNEMFRMPFLLL
jgi:hypothetical protein